jgi:hypothetical protein
MECLRGPAFTRAFQGKDRTPQIIVQGDPRFTRVGSYGIVTLLRAIGESPAPIGRSRKR